MNEEVSNVEIAKPQVHSWGESNLHFFWLNINSLSTSILASIETSKSKMNQKNQFVLIPWKKRRKTNYSIDVTSRLAKLAIKIRKCNKIFFSILDANLNHKCQGKKTITRKLRKKCMWKKSWIIVA
jgi:hypothetical protein